MGIRVDGVDTEELIDLFKGITEGGKTADATLITEDAIKGLFEADAGAAPVAAELIKAYKEFGKIGATAAEKAKALRSISENANKLGKVSETSKVAEVSKLGKQFEELGQLSNKAAETQEGIDAVDGLDAARKTRTAARKVAPAEDFAIVNRVGKTAANLAAQFSRPKVIGGTFALAATGTAFGVPLYMFAPDIAGVHNRKAAEQGQKTKEAEKPSGYVPPTATSYVDPVTKQIKWQAPLSTLSAEDRDGATPHLDPATGKPVYVNGDLMVDVTPKKKEEESGLGGIFDWISKEVGDHPLIAAGLGAAAAFMGSGKDGAMGTIMEIGGLVLLGFAAYKLYQNYAHPVDALTNSLTANPKPA